MTKQQKSNKPKENGANRNEKGQFGPGNTASVGKGRPKGSRSIPDILRKIAEEEGTTEGITKLEVVLRQVFRYALEGKSWAVEFIANRTEGKPHQSIGIRDETDEPIKVFDVNEVDD